MSDIDDIYGKLNGKVTREQFSQLIDDKIDAMDGLCDQWTAALLVAHDLGLDDLTAVKKSPGGAAAVSDGGSVMAAGGALVKIKDISMNQRNVDFVGRVTTAYPPRTFSRQDGTTGSVANITVADETGEVRVSLWDDLADAVKTGDIKEGDTLRVRGYVKEGQKGLEVSIGRGGGIMKDDSVKITLKDPMVKIADIKVGNGNVSTRGVVLSRQEPRTFSRKDGSSGTLASFMLGDETGKIRVTAWDTKVQDLDPFQPGESIELLHGYTREGFNGGVEVNVGSRGILRKSETDVRYEEATTKIGDITPDNSYNVKGTVTGIDGVREFTTKDGKAGRLCGVWLSDDTGRVRVVFWGEHANFAEALSVGDEILVTDTQAKVGMKGDIELGANWRSSVRKTK
jgi:Single-stranded DNA-binding replication protein A (RPA), large (70 kD) subunit and related ssDNA-binding proteins